jgi:hypothetical protein
MPLIDVSDKAFNTPSQDDLAGAPEYWDGYASGKSVVMRGLFPFPSNFASYAKLDNPYGQYHLDVLALLPQASMYGYPIAGIAGSNNAIIDGSNYIWQNDPNSPDRRVYS